MGRIITTYVFPPIPIRDFDWQAIYEDDEPNDNGGMPIGRGSTEDAAIQELLEHYPRCKERGGAVGPRGECFVCDAESGVACRGEARNQ